MARRFEVQAGVYSGERDTWSEVSMGDDNRSSWIFEFGGVFERDAVWRERLSVRAGLRISLALSYGYVRFTRVPSLIYLRHTQMTL
jgi:hypothetical protein